jgi:hypothetical protein
MLEGDLSEEVGSVGREGEEGERRGRSSIEGEGFSGVDEENRRDERRRGGDGEERGEDIDVEDMNGARKVERLDVKKEIGGETCREQVPKLGRTALGFRALEQAFR